MAKKTQRISIVYVMDWILLLTTHPLLFDQWITLWLEWKSIISSPYNLSQFYHKRLAQKVAPTTGMCPGHMRMNENHETWFCIIINNVALIQSEGFVITCSPCKQKVYRKSLNSILIFILRNRIHNIWDIVWKNYTHSPRIGSCDKAFFKTNAKLCSKSFAKVQSCYCHTSTVKFNKYEWFECWKRWLFWKHRSDGWKRDSWLGPDTATKALHECLAGEAFRETHQKQHRRNIYIHVELVHITLQFTINSPVRALWVYKLLLGPHRHFVAGQ